VSPLRPFVPTDPANDNPATPHHTTPRPHHPTTTATKTTRIPDQCHVTTSTSTIPIDGTQGRRSSTSMVPSGRAASSDIDDVHNVVNVSPHYPQNDCIPPRPTIRLAGAASPTAMWQPDDKRIVVRHRPCPSKLVPHLPITFSHTDSRCHVAVSDVATKR
jgi:hypothetical protein